VTNDAERNECILKNLERGSEQSFSNFCKALDHCKQGFLITLMNESILRPQQRSTDNESVPVSVSSCVAERVPVSCTEHTVVETTSPTEIQQSTQGSFMAFVLLLFAYCCL